MKLEEIKKSMPEMPEFIHERILKEVNNQLEKKQSVMDNVNGGRRKYRWKGVYAAAAAFGLLGISTAVYGGYRLYSMYVKNQGTYAIQAGISKEKNEEEMHIPEKIKDVEIRVSYIPEGMEWTAQNRLVWPDSPHQGGFSFGSVLLDNKDLEQVLTDTGVVESEERMFGKREGIYLRYQDLKQDQSFNQRIYLLCPEEYQVLIIYIGDDVSKEEAIKVTESISLVETGKMLDTKDLYTWGQFVNPKEEISGETKTSIPEDELILVKPGEPLEITASGETESGEYLSVDGIKVTVEDVRVEDDLSLLKENLIPEEWKTVVGNDGKLKDSKLSYIKAGDGVETLDEVVKEEKVKQKLLHVTVTYENPTDTPLYHMLYLGSIMLLEQKEGNLQICQENASKEEEYDFIMEDSAVNTREMGYASIREDYGNGGNYIPVLKAGESVQVEMAWIVKEKDLKNMFLNLSGEGAVWEFSESIQQTGLADIRR